jgi:general secretion pathway protein D
MTAHSARFPAHGFAFLLSALALGGCAANHDLVALRSASQSDPTNAERQLDYLRERDRQVSVLLDEAERLRLIAQFDAALQRLQAAVQLDPGNERARRIAATVRLDRRSAAELKEAERLFKQGGYESAADRVRAVLAENPNYAGALQLLRDIEQKRHQQRRAHDEKIAASSLMKKPVTLQFRDANVRMVFEALARTSGLNIILDRDVRSDLKTTIFVTNATLEDTVDMILMQNQLEKRMLSPNTLFVYPASAAKKQEYQELKVRTFQLSNIEAKQIQALLKGLLKIKDVIIDEHANTVSVRDTPDAIRVAEQLIAAQDLPEPEVMLEVNVLEVSRDRMTDLGIEWPNSFGISTPSSVSTLGDLRHLKRDALSVTPLAASANLKLTDTDANLLASPRIRTRNKEKAKILIGDKVPVISSTSTPSTSGPSFTQTVQYIDVGIKLEVEPQVYRDDDVGIRLNLEVSNITKTISNNDSSTGLSSLAYQIGTRSASTSLRLKDGESQILGGLISDSDRSTADKVPGLGQLPLLGHLFSNHNGDHGKTEIVLQITPHIIRPQLTADADTQEVWSGTDGSVRAERWRAEPDASGAAAATPGGVGGSGGAGGAASASSPVVTAPPGGAFGQQPVPMRTTPPPEPYGGRFASTPGVPPAAPTSGNAGAANPAVPQADSAPGAANDGATDSAPAAPASPAAPAAGSGPVQPPASPPPPLSAPPSDMSSDNPLHPIQPEGSAP